MNLVNSNRVFTVSFVETLSGEEVNVQDNLKQNSMSVIEVLTNEIAQISRTLR